MVPPPNQGPRHPWDRDPGRTGDRWPPDRWPAAPLPVRSAQPGGAGPAGPPKDVIVSLRSAAATAVKLLAATGDALTPPVAGTVVLCYHRVGAASGMAVDLPLDLFRRQLDWIAASGRAVTLDEALDQLAHPGAGAVGRIVVTFDDGTADFADLALPELEERGIPAVLYLATAFVEEGREHPHGGQPLSWAALADAVETGVVTVGSHTHRHRLLDRLPPPEVDEELDRSIQLIADRLGRAARHFAYPKAVAGSAHADAAVRARFRSAALAGTRANPPGTTDPHRLNRSPVQVSDGFTWFRRKAEGGLRLEDSLRRTLNRRRYATATT